VIIRKCCIKGGVGERKDHDIAYRGVASTGDGLNMYYDFFSRIYCLIIYADNLIIWQSVYPPPL
jgi:hypothetical protein